MSIIKSSVDLIIPTYNRPKFLNRILDYYNHHGVTFKIIVIDSSSRLNKKQNRKIISFYPKLNIQYVGKFPQELPPHIKYAQMVNYAKSKYCVFCPDDDFIVPNGIKEAVNFLEKNPDYSAAHGSYISFYIYKNPFGVNKFWWRFIYPYQSITSSNPSQRLVTHLTNYYLVLWSVRRTELLKHAYKEFIKSRVDPYLFGELLPDMLTLVLGKMKRLNSFYAARQAFSTSYGYWPSLIDAQNKGIYDNEYKKFKNCLAKNLNKVGMISLAEAELIIDSSMKIYLKNTVQEHLTGRANLILRNFPKFISSIVSRLHIIYLFSLKKLFSSQTRDAIRLIDSKDSKYFSDFDAIKQVALKNNL